LRTSRRGRHVGVRRGGWQNRRHYWNQKFEETP
jgi:hypothetical protein